MLHRLAPLALLAAATTASADVPFVATDIAPVHGLVARVMSGVGAPELIIDPGASPHGYAMRPSEARALQAADIVVWVGPELTPWFADRLETLAPRARSVDLLHVAGTLLLDMREETVFAEAGEDHDHDDEHGREEDHGHDDEHGQEHGQEDEHDDEHGHDDDHGHSHEGTDPHAWLDPQNARVWLGHIAEVLSAADPENAATYAQNAEDAIAEIDSAEAEARKGLEGAEETAFIVFHDAYHYLETRFGLRAAAALSGSDATDAGPAHLRALQVLVAERGVGCAFAEPQFNGAALETVLEGSGAQVATLDPLGRDITPGPDFYPAFLRALGADLAGCLVK